MKLTSSKTPTDPKIIFSSSELILKWGIKCKVFQILNTFDVNPKNHRVALLTY